METFRFIEMMSGKAKRHGFELTFDLPNCLRRRLEMYHNFYSLTSPNGLGTFIHRPEIVDKK